jgi:hypothetical protein
MSTVYNVNGLTYAQWREETDQLIRDNGYGHLIEQVEFDWTKRYHAGQKSTVAVSDWMNSLTLDLTS